MTKEEIYSGVCQCIAETHTVEKDTIRPEDKLIEDLGLDSLDLLDLTFHLQQRFKIAISPRDAERRVREKLGAVPLEVDGVYTAGALEEFAAAMPEIPREEFAEGLTTADFPRRLRVATMTNLVVGLLEESNE
jgi:acyl carrier protein